MVGVLVLVDQEVAEPPLVERRHVRERAEQIHGLGDEVVEVERVRVAQRATVAAARSRGTRIGSGRRSSRCGRTTRGLAARSSPSEMRPMHARDREAHRVGLEVLHDALHERAGIGGVVDRERLREPEVLGLAPEDAHARRVEGRDPHPVDRVADQSLDALAHLAGRLVRERDGQDLARPRIPALQQPRDAPGQHVGLARSGSRDDQQRLPAVLDRLALPRVQPLEQLGVDARARLTSPSPGGLVGLRHDHHDPSILPPGADAHPAARMKEFLAVRTGTRGCRARSSRISFIPALLPKSRLRSGPT